MIVILGGLGSYLGVIVGSFILIFLLEGTRYIDLPLSDASVAAMRFMIVGLVLMALVFPAAGDLRQARGAALRGRE